MPRNVATVLVAVLLDVLEVVPPVVLVHFLGALLDESHIIVAILVERHLIEAFFMPLGQVHTLQMHHLFELIVSIFEEINCFLSESRDSHSPKEILISLLRAVCHQMRCIVLVEVPKVEILQALAIIIHIVFIDLSAIINFALVVV